MLSIDRVAIAKWVYRLCGKDALLIGAPNVAIAAAKRSPPKEVREVATQTVVTVIEVLSPTNKRPRTPVQKP